MVRAINSLGVITEIELIRVLSCEAWKSFTMRSFACRNVEVTRFAYKIATDQTQCEIGIWFGNGLIFAMSDFDLAFSAPDFDTELDSGPVKP